MNSKVYIILGASSSGKTTSLEYLKTINFQVITKETTRKRREDDTAEVINVSSISEECDFIYTQYEVNYGFRSSDIWQCISKNISCALVVNDIRSIKLLRRMFGEYLSVIYLHSNVSSHHIIENEKQRYATGQISSQAVNHRVERIKATHRKYIENISLFDHVVINVGEREDLYAQLMSVVNQKDKRKNTSKTNSKLFIVCGSSLSGKKELAEAMQGIQKENIFSYKKITSREKRSESDMGLDHLSNNEFPDGYDIIYKKQGFEYAVSTTDIWQGLQNNKTYILLLNDVKTIERLQEEFSAFCISIYLHSGLGSDELKKSLLDNGLSMSEVEERVAVANSLSKNYFKKLKVFDHVLLNTTALEDLYDQAFSIYDHYCY